MYLGIDVGIAIPEKWEDFDWRHISIEPKTSVTLKIDVREGIESVLKNVVHRAKYERGDDRMSVKTWRAKCDCKIHKTDDTKECVCDAWITLNKKYNEMPHTHCGYEWLEEKIKMGIKDSEFKKMYKCVRKWVDLFKEASALRTRMIDEKVLKQKDQSSVVSGFGKLAVYSAIFSPYLIEWLTGYSSDESNDLIAVEAAVTPVSCMISKDVSIGPSLHFDLRTPQFLNFGLGNKFDKPSTAFAAHQSFFESCHTEIEVSVKTSVEGIHDALI